MLGPRLYKRATSGVHDGEHAGTSGLGYSGHRSFGTGASCFLPQATADLILDATKLRSTAAVLPSSSLPKNTQLLRPTAMYGADRPLGVVVDLEISVLAVAG